MDGWIEIQPGLSIPAGELRFSASRSSGPGGQNVNKVNSRVTLQFAVDDSPSLDAGQKARIRERLATRVTRDGVLQLHCQMHRSYAANRELIVERFRELLAGALRREVPRRPTRASAAQRRQRAQQKQRRAELKRSRRAPRGDND